MRRLRYSVAMSLDGFIAGPRGEFDWIVVDPEIDFAAMYSAVSGLVMGRKSYEVFVATGGAVGPPLPTYVYSRTLPEGTSGGISIGRDPVTHVRTLKDDAEDKPLWLWGGSDLFGELAKADLVDEVSVAVIPVILGDGIPLMPARGPHLKLQLTSHKRYAATGTIALDYRVVRTSRPAHSGRRRTT